MNQNAKENIIFACQHYKNIAICINIFCDLLIDFENMMDPVTNRDILVKGLYASLFGSSVYVSKTVKPYHIMISNTEQGIAFNDKKWSENISLLADPDVFKKYEKMKVFW